MSVRRYRPVVTAGQRRGDRDAVFDRDDHTCRRCGTTADEDPEGLRCCSVGDAPPDGRVHESSLVTVCSPCFDSLRTEPDGPVVPPSDDLFALVRTTTEREGVTVSAVAAFASLTTGLPDELESADADPTATADLAAEYRRARREVLLAIESVDAALDRLRAVDADALEPTVADAVDEFAGTATKLQSELRGIVALGETVVAGLDRCRGCFEPVASAGEAGDEDDGTDAGVGADDDAPSSDDVCETCGLERRDVDAWRGDDGDVAFEQLYGAVNETLQTASGTTEALTDRTTAVAERLRGD